jgi:DNA-binding NarL/FixJ family response regulator
VPRTRVLMAAMPPILYDIVRELAAEEPDLEVVGHVGPEADLAVAVEACGADVVLSGAACSGREASERLLRAFPHLRVLTVTADRRAAYLDRLLPHRTEIADMSADDLIDALLGAGEYGPGRPVG